MFGNLRLVATDKLSEYRANTDLFLKLGNEDFAAAIRAGIPALALPFTVGGNDRAQDLFGLFDDTLDQLLRVAP